MNTKYIKKVAENYPYSYENPSICKVELWDFSRANENKESRKEAVTTVASISHGNEFSKNPNRLWNLLIKNGEESPFEFVKIAPFWGMNADKQLNVEMAEYHEDSLRCGIFDYEPDNEPYRYVGYPYAYATFKLKVPIFVARQIMRHRTFSFMEMSRRYVKGNKVKFEYWKPKKFSELLLVFQKLAKSLNIQGSQVQVGLFEYIEEFYNFLLEDVNAKPEQARAFLPLGLYTQFWMQGDYKAWLNFFIYRLAPEAQKETRLVALSMWNLLKKYQPEIIETMKEYLKDWVQECNPMFKPAREKKAKWFKDNFLKGGINERF